MRKKLGVNIDHVATIRQARMADYPDPVHAAAIAELAGADGITIHLREDRRHIQERDVQILKKSVKTSLNLEMALNPEIVEIALEIAPNEVCIVPEKRQEVTTEGGLDVIGNRERLSEIVPRLQKKGIEVSLFIDPDRDQLQASRDVGARVVELHTGSYANARPGKEAAAELKKIAEAAKFGASIGLQVNAGHGLHYQNVYAIAEIAEIDTLNIGHSIISQAIFVGLDRAVRDMIAILDRANIDGIRK